jgi:hypothetical protein
MLFGRHHPRARSPFVFAALVVGGFLGVGCTSDRVIQPDRDGEVTLNDPATLESALGAPVPIDVDTYEASRQVVHPSAVVFPSAWHGQRFWLALTPYPNSDSHVENPSLYTGATGSDWMTPKGLTNPVARTSRGYLSDPDLTYDPAADELRLYYREVMEKHHDKAKPTHEADVVYLARSKDGVTWSPAQPVVADVGRFVVSPAIARRAEGDWRMWSVDAGHSGCTAGATRIIMRHSSDGVAWSTPSRVSFSQPGYEPWHLDVQYVPQLNAYWALVAAYPKGGTCTGTSLFLATSSDGMHWTTFPSPLLARGVMPQFSTNVYRSTFAFDEDAKGLTIWLTGATTVKQREAKKPAVLRWTAAVWRTSREAILTHVNVAPTPASVPRVYPDSQLTFLRRMAVENTLP